MKDLKQLFAFAVVVLFGFALFNYETILGYVSRADMHVSRKLAENPFPNAKTNTEKERQDGMNARREELARLRNMK